MRKQYQVGNPEFDVIRGVFREDTWQSVAGSSLLPAESITLGVQHFQNAKLIIIHVTLVPVKKA